MPDKHSKTGDPAVGSTRLVRRLNPKCPTCGNELLGMLSGLGLMQNKGVQIWCCFFPCNMIMPNEKAHRREAAAGEATKTKQT